ncbi:MAG: hypothetical protein HS113_13985 [Verrucomicrobiales bacterium]|nr:hypothetical protein [Verrucomicrobiales bacterium]
MGLLVGLAALAVFASVADDDDDVPPFDPGIGFEGILPNPPLPSYLIADQRTSPHGVRQVFNTPATLMGQSFRPTQPTVDWVAFVFQNHTQPNTTPGPGVLRVSLFTSLETTQGALSGLLAESETVAIPSNTTAWLIFSFPQSVPVTPGATYYCRVEHVSGYPAWVGGRLHDFYAGGRAFGYLPNPFGGPIQNLNWGQYDLVFATGTGRGKTGVTVGEYLQWGLSRGLRDYDEWGDADEDGEPLFIEYLRDADPRGAGGSAKSRWHVVEADGARYLAWTVATPARFDYRSTAAGSIRGGTDAAADVFAPALDVQGSRLPGFGLLEVVPALDEGLPAISPAHRYRTFRLNEPVASRPSAFILNCVMLGED